MLRYIAIAFLFVAVVVSAQQTICPASEFVFPVCGNTLMDMRHEDYLERKLRTELWLLHREQLYSEYEFLYSVQWPSFARSSSSYTNQEDYRGYLLNNTVT